MIPLLISVALGAVTLDLQPVVGQETVVVVTDDADQPAVGLTVSVVHRPGLGGERELAVGITDARGRVRWTPASAGVAELRVRSQRLPITIDWASAPRGALTLLIMLALAALGASLGGLRRARAHRSAPR